MRTSSVVRTDWWSTEDEAFVIAFYDSMSYREMAEKLGKTYGSVKKKGGQLIKEGILDKTKGSYYVNHGNKLNFETCQACESPNKRSLGHFCSSCQIIFENFCPVGLVKYRMSDIQWMKMFLNQEGKCLCCGIGSVKLMVDHDHNCCDPKEKGRYCGNCVRGLVCRYCNIAVSFVEDGKLELYLAYVEKWKAVIV